MYNGKKNYQTIRREKRRRAEIPKAQHGEKNEVGAKVDDSVRS